MIVIFSVRGSAASLFSTGSSSLYSTAEDKQTQEMRRLQKDLNEAREKVQTLEGQLSTNVSTHAFFLLFYWREIWIVTLVGATKILQFGFNEILNRNVIKLIFKLL